MKFLLAADILSDNICFFDILFYFWKDILDIDIKLLLIADKLPNLLRPFRKNIILFKPLENIDIQIQTDLLKYVYPSILDDYNSNFIVTDIKRIGLNKDFFNQLTNNDNFDLTSNIYVLEKNYIYTNKSISRKIFNIKNLNDIRNFIKNNTTIDNFNKNIINIDSNILQIKHNPLLFKKVWSHDMIDKINQGIYTDYELPNKLYNNRTNLLNIFNSRYDNIKENIIKRFYNRIDQIFIINLNKRQDRWKKITQELKNIGLTKYKKISGIVPYGKLLRKYRKFLPDIEKNNQVNKEETNKENPEEPDKEAYVLTKKKRIGKLGRLLSHLEIYKICRRKKYTNVLILEDDIGIKYIEDNPKENKYPANIFNTIFKALNDLSLNLKPFNSIMYLCANHIESCEFIDNNVMSVRESFGTLAYIVNENIVDKLIRDLSNPLAELEIYLAKYLQKNIECFCTYPHIFYPKSDMSDIEGVYMDYKKMVNSKDKKQCYTE